MDALLRGLAELTVRSSRCSCHVSRTFSSTASNLGTTARAKRRHKDPYAIAQAAAKRAANNSRQIQLRQTRLKARGEPVRGRLTPFVAAFDTASPPPAASARSADIRLADEHRQFSAKDTDQVGYLNYGVTPDELDGAISRSLLWAGQRRDKSSTYDDEEALRARIFNPDPNSKAHTIATEAMKRITAMRMSSSKDRLRVNIRRCISTFGRHQTDEHLPPKPAPSPSYVEVLTQANGGVPQATKTPRAGPDTGSSEVQIAILTAKIRALYTALDSTGRTDKVNKRNLRLMVHKRQKLLKYMERKERGGPRFRNVVDVLGLEPASWRGEISLK